MPTILTRAQSQALDHAAKTRLGIPTILLMEHAAASLLHHTLQLLTSIHSSIHSSIRTPSASSGTNPPPPVNNNTLVILFAGPGNNGGDAYALARLLHLQHIPTLLIPVGPPANPTSDAAINRTIAQRLELPFLTFDAHAPTALHARINAATTPSVSPANPEATSPATSPLKGIILIDALLGTGASRPLSPDIATAVRLINELRQAHPNTRTLAVDLPTGLDADTGEPLGTTDTTADTTRGTSPIPAVETASSALPTIVQADLTVTLASLKPGLIATAAQPYVGHLVVADIGLPHRFIAEFAAAQQR